MTVRLERLRAGHTTTRLEVGRYLPSLVLAGYGILILSLAVRGDLILYINPTYVVPSITAAVALLVFGVVRLVRWQSRSCDCADECCDDGCGAAPARIWPYVALSIPLVLAVLFPPRGLAAFSATQRGLQIAGLSTVRNATAVKHVTLSVDTRSFSLQDWVGALSADPNPRDYLGKPIIISGLVVHDSASVPPGYIMVLRYQVTCCIADARPEGLIVKDTSHGALKDNQWVTVTGAMGETAYQGDKVAVVMPSSIKLTKAGNPYMY